MYIWNICFSSIYAIKHFCKSAEVGFLWVKLFSKLISMGKNTKKLLSYMDAKKYWPPTYYHHSIRLPWLEVVDQLFGIINLCGFKSRAELDLGHFLGWSDFYEANQWCLVTNIYIFVHLIPQYLTYVVNPQRSQNCNVCYIALIGN